MRWVNHAPHPADNRYEVFRFRERAHADAFQARCEAASIPFEKHEEDGEVMFGISRAHFREALRANHLVHAEFRTPFIPHRGWRVGVLVFTGAVLLLALMGWCSTAAAQAVDPGLPWELDVVGRVHVPVAMLGMEPQVVEEGALSAMWEPKTGTEFGLRIHRRLRDGWTLGGGLEWVRREHLVVASYVNDTLGVATRDTFPQLTSLAYRLPLLGGIRIPLGWRSWELQASAGMGLEWRTSENVVSMQVQTDGADHIVQSYLGRARFVSVPVLAEFGVQRAASKGQAGWYVGGFWSSPVGRGAWAENTWQSGFVAEQARDWISLVVTGIDLRLVLPE